MESLVSHRTAIAAGRKRPTVILSALTVAFALTVHTAKAAPGPAPGSVDTLVPPAFAPLPNAGRPVEALAESLAADWLAEAETDGMTEAAGLALETLQDCLAHPLSVNTANYDDLEALGLLTPWEIEALLRYRADYGHIVGPHELTLIPDFPVEKARQLAPFLSFEAEPTGGSDGRAQTGNHPSKARPGHELSLRYGRALTRTKAYAEHRYAGTPDAAALRYRFKAGDRLQIGLAMEKDAGEKRFPDSWAGYIAFGGGTNGRSNSGTNSNGGSNNRNNTNRNATDRRTNTGTRHRDRPFRTRPARAPRLDTWIIGTYTLHFGYGLHLGGGLFGGALDAELLSRPGNGLKPFSSTAESGYFSGSAVRLNLARRTDLTLFYSRRTLDAAVEEGRITSLATSGYHRTETERGKWRQAVQQATGFALEQKFQRLKIGTTFSYTGLDKPYTPRIALYNQFNHLSDKVLGGSIHYRALFRNLHLYGEIGWSGILRMPQTTNTPQTHTFSAALFHGLQWKIHPRLSLAANLRYYPRSYGGFFVQAPGRQSKAYNELGFILLTRTNVTDRLHIELSADLAVRDWYAYPAKPPGADLRCDARIAYTARRHALQVYALYQYRDEATANNRGTTRHIPRQTVPDMPNDLRNTPTGTHRLRLHLSYDSPGGFLCRSRLEWLPAAKSVAKSATPAESTATATTASPTSNNPTAARSAYLLYQDVGYRLPSGKFSVQIRYALFQTESGNERFYVYEADLLYNSAFPSYSGRGQRFYVFLRYRPFRFMTLEARYAHTLHDQRFTAGSGLNESPGFLQPEIKCQIRFKF